MDHTKIDPADLDSLCRELSVRGLGFVVAFSISWKIHVFGTYTGAPALPSAAIAAATLAVATLAPPIDQQPPPAVSTSLWHCHPGASHSLERPQAILPAPNAQQNPSLPSPVSPCLSPSAGSVT